MLDRFHKISEIVAAFALVASLLFVGVQISQNTDATRVSNAQAAFQTWSEQGLAVAASDSLSQILIDSMYPEARTALSVNTDYMRLQNYQAAVLKTNEVLFLQWKNGHLSDDVWHGYRSTLVWMFASYEGLNQLWGQLRGTYSPEFVAHIDQLRVEGAKIRSENYAEVTGASD